jgi:OmcA/MtrC family decaheme c-type cytochrome
VQGADFSHVTFPQPVQNCAVCHEDAPQGEVHMTKPTIEGCASCHDRTWFGDPLATPEGFTNHIAGQQVDNSLCALCHTPTAPGPAPIMEAHRLATNSPLAPGLAFTVNETTTAETETGVAVTINFTAANGAGEPYTDLTAIRTVAATLAYPVSEYQQSYRETITAANAVANGDGTFNYTFTREMPLGSTDTFAVAMDGRLDFDNNGTTVTQGTSSNGRMIFTTDGSEPVERRQIVDNEKCNVCHSDLRLHGSLRVGVEYCVMCHNPNGTDVNRRPAEMLPPETINFKDMVHQIHRGADLETDYTVFGFGSTPFDFTHIGFPGDLRNCEICHIEGTYELPLAEEALPTVVREGETVVSEKLPERASCTSCHDSLITEVHAILATEPNTRVESCSTCHDSSAEFAVIDVHNMGP